MSDMLARRRLKDNLVDQLEDAQRRVGQLERAVSTPDDYGRLTLPGLLLVVLAETPAPPPAGQVLLYVVDEGGAMYLRAMDYEGTVKTLDSWV